MEKKRIMVVDDEQDFLRITKLNLEKTGRFDVLTLSRVEDIIAQLHDYKPDVILLDMLMPKMGGLEACEMLNKDPVGKAVPVIVLSALNKDKDRLKAYKAGVVDYIVKPVEKNILIDKIEKALQFK